MPLKFPREGIRYDDLTEEEKDDWDALDWGEDGDVPTRSPPRRSTSGCSTPTPSTRCWQTLMTDGPQGRRRRPARQDDHLRQEQRSRRVHRGSASTPTTPSTPGTFARVITYKTEYAQSLIDDFSIKDKAPHIAISVDMLDTGIDMPEVVNLVFFKPVRSKTKFWQMIGRGTRLCPDLFGPGEDKQDFFVFDFCDNLEFFNQNPAAADGRVAAVAGRAALRRTARRSSPALTQNCR